MIKREILEQVSLQEIKLYKNNPRKNDGSVDFVVNSIKEFGYGNPIIVDENMEIITGHTRYKAIKKLGWQELPEVVKISGLTEEQKKAYRIADNSTGQNSEWDIDLLNLELQDISLDMVDFGLDLDLINLEQTSSVEADVEQYTKKIEAPIYTPKGEKPTIGELYNQDKTNKLKDKIEKSNLPEDIKEFLKITANRHTVFNYGKIAEFYCHADKDTQLLMEDLTLIIIDFKKAIEDGYIKLSEAIAEQYDIDYNIRVDIDEE